MELEGIIPEKVMEFVTNLGITVKQGIIEEKTFLPGFRISGTTLTVDPSIKGFQPGDVLHESAHICLCRPDRRETLGPKDLYVPVEEMVCHPWCWAALTLLELDPQWVFHSDYKADGDWLINTFSEGGTLGQPMLQYWELTNQDGVEWPDMVSWIRMKE